MFIYIFGFISSSFLLELSTKKTSKSVKFILASLGIFIPSLIAGLRAASIGTDVKVYGISTFELALNCSNISEFYGRLSTGYMDFGFYFVPYIMSKISNDYHIALFFYEFITMIFVYLFAKKCNQKYNVSIGLLCFFYLLSLYNTSLNIMRQCIAVAIVSYAFTFLLDKKYFYYFLFTFIAFSFHSTSLITLILLPLYKLLGNGKFGSMKEIVKLTVVIISFIFVLLFFDELVNLLADVGMLNSRYLEYVEGGEYAVQKASKVNSSSLLIQPLLLIFMLLFSKNVDSNKKVGMNFYLFCCFLVGFISIFGQLYSEYISRIYYYFLPIQMLGLVISLKFIKGKEHFYWLSYTFCLIFALWIFGIVIRNGNETYPYMFFWQY